MGSQIVFIKINCYLHELHDDLLQEVQPEPEEENGFSTPLIPKRDNFFLIFPEQHFGHDISG